MSAKYKLFMLDTLLALSMTMLAIHVFTRYVPFSLVFNVTASIPLGVYVSEELEPYAFLRPGDTVCFKYGTEPSVFAGRNYFEAKDTICKPLAGWAGDKVRSDESGIYLSVADGPEKKVAVYATKDRKGRALTPFFTQQPYVLSGNELLLIAGAKPNSLDSRYIGPVDRSRVEKRIHALVTWSE